MNDSQFLGELLFRAYQADVISIGEVKDACERFEIPCPPNLVQNERYNGKTPATLSHAPGFLTNST